MSSNRPLSVHALTALRQLQSYGPIICQRFNAGVVHKLVAEGFAVVVQIPSPFKTHNGRAIAHLAISAAGRERLAIELKES